jgi:Flp pilus assembly protein TadD
MSKKTYAHPLSLACIGSFFLLVVASQLARANTAADIDQLLASGRYQEAQAIAESVLSRQPRDMQMRFVTGVIQLETGNPDDAIRTFRALAAEYPQLPEPHNNLAVIFAGRGQFEEAREALEKAIQTNPSYARAHENLGDIHAKLATQAYSSALRLDGNNTGIAPKLSLIQSLFSLNEGGAQKKAATMPAAAGGGAGDG